MTESSALLIESLLKAAVPAGLTAGFALVAAKMAINAAASRDLANHRRDQISKILDLVLEQLDEVTQLELALRSALNSCDECGSDEPSLSAEAERNYLDSYERLIRNPTHQRISLMTQMWFDTELHTAALKFEIAILDLRNKISAEPPEDSDESASQGEMDSEYFLWPYVRRAQDEANAFMTKLADYAERYAV